MNKINKVLVVLVIILSVFVLALSGYLINDKILKNNTNSNDWMDYIMNSDINSIELSYCLDNTYNDHELPIRETINITNNDLSTIFNEMKKGTITKHYYGGFGGPCMRIINVKYTSNETEYVLKITDGGSILSIDASSKDKKILTYLENTEHTINNYDKETDLTNAPYTFEYTYNGTIIDEIINNYTK